LQYVLKINKALQETGKIIGGISIVLMMTIIVLDVFLRNFFATPIPGSYAIIENYLMPIAIFPVLGYVYMENILPKLGEFVSKKSKQFQKINNIILLFMDTIVFILLTYYSFIYFLGMSSKGMEIQIATKFVPIWPVYFVVPLGFFLVFLEVILRLIKEIKKKAISS